MFFKALHIPLCQDLPIPSPSRCINRLNRTVFHTLVTAWFGQYCLKYSVFAGPTSVFMRSNRATDHRTIGRTGEDGSNMPRQLSRVHSALHCRKWLEPSEPRRQMAFRREMLQKVERCFLRGPSQVMQRYTTWPFHDIPCHFRTWIEALRNKPSCRPTDASEVPDAVGHCLFHSGCACHLQQLLQLDHPCRNASQPVELRLNMFD